MAAAVAVAVGLALATVWAAHSGGREEVHATLSLAETLGGADTAGYRRAAGPRPFRFPADHGPHPGFRTEWWYVTGNLEAADGRRFGYQLTFFRKALSPRRPDLDSDWSTSQAWMAHLAVTDPAAGRFRAFERFDRQALGLAGAREGPFRVWLGDWRLAKAGEAGDGGAFPMSLTAAAGEVSLDLVLEPVKGPVLQGEGGLSRKGPDPGDASYYYSFPRLRTTGRIRTAAGPVTVRGTSWLDREWSTSVLPERVAGWDWFGLQLDDGRELMVYVLRRRDGSPEPFSAGVLVDPEGHPHRLDADAFRIDPLGRWESPVGGTSYPSGWRVQVPGAGLDLRVVPVLRDQELDLSFRYWEGAVDVKESEGTGGVTGVGYVELTGYGEGSGRSTAGAVG
ncbi:MAG TPA: lipocalin-like domain-containing protein [Longimicrobiales bacterium]|nr:lipocalin-like domain-containing protein [Longimicrobiales bacterium]